MVSEEYRTCNTGVMHPSHHISSYHLVPGDALMASALGIGCPSLVLVCLIA